jgi:glyoxylate reductase
MARCFITRPLPGPALERLRAEHEVEVWERRLPPTPAELARHAAGADGLLTLLTDRVDTALIDACPNLKTISNYAVGYDNIDLAAATRRGITVGNTPDVLTDATADLAFALLLAAARKLPEAARAVREGDWLTWEPARYLGREVHGATLGIIGLGRIGRAVAIRAEGFGMRVVSAGRDGGIDAVLSEADFLSLHAPLTPVTRHLINAGTLGKMRPTAILINTARGGLVDQAALRTALEQGTIAGAALDVTEPEPLAPDDPLLSAPNLIVTPHIGSATQATRERMAGMAVDNLLAGLDGRPLPHQAN